MYIRSYNDIRNFIESSKRAEAIIAKHNNGIIPEDCKEFIDEKNKEFKKKCRQFYRSQNRHPAPYSVPVLNSKNIWRTVSTDGGETGTDFIIIPDNGETKEDIDEFVYDTVFCGWGDLLIDCTGKRCSRGWSFRRVPCGIVITHDWVYDY